MLQNYSIHNVVASATLDSTISLSELAIKLDRAEYEPEQFPGLVYRLEEPRAAALIFNSGKIVCTGTKSVEDAKRAVDTLVNIINNNGVKTNGKHTVVIQNIVASTYAGKSLDLNKVAFEMEGTEYEPEQFPGLIYRLDEPPVVFLLFQTGKIVCTGGKDPRDIERGIQKLEERLREIGAI